MWVIGIKGGIGSGKSQVMKFLQSQWNAEVILADEAAHELMEPGQPGYDEVVSLLGYGILQEDGRIDRQAMAARIFHDEQLLNQVNQLIHPMVWDRIKSRIRKSQKELVAVEAALVDEREKNLYDEVWYVYASEETRISRLMEGRGYTREKAESIMKQQLSPEEYRNICTRVIDNEGTLEETEKQINQIVRNRLK